MLNLPQVAPLHHDSPDDQLKVQVCKLTSHS
jgi:hypothetical protein